MKKILIIQTASIGDVILSTALAETMHKKFPGASIGFLVKKGHESLFSGHPFIHKVITWDKLHGKYSGFIHVLREVRNARYDLVINIQRFFLTGLLTALSGSGETRGFSKNPLSFLFTKRIKHQIDRGIHEVKRNHALISDLAADNNPLPRLYPSPADQAVAGQFVAGKYYTSSPASLWFTKQYPVEKWIELIRSVPREASIFLLGAPADNSLCDDIITQAGHGRSLNLSGKLTFLQSAALMKQARMNFTNDSAPMHIASSVNAPVTAIYCSTIPGFGFGPLSADSAIAETSSPLPCRPCGLHGYNTCPEKHFLCAYGIETGKLTERL